MFTARTVYVITISLKDRFIMEAVYFRDQEEFREWLEKNHSKADELIVGYYKVGSSKHNMSWSQSVDQALCFGWIDGVRKSIDGERYCIRFTPRKSTSIWSNINIKKVEELQKKGLMKKAGLDAFNKRKMSKSGIYSFENEIKQLDTAYEETFKANSKAWAFFSKQAPSYKRTRIHLVMSAKQEATRIARLNKLIEASENITRLY